MAASLTVVQPHDTWQGEAPSLVRAGAASSGMGEEHAFEDCVADWGRTYDDYDAPAGTAASGGGLGGPSRLALGDLSPARAPTGSFYGGFVRMRTELWGRDETRETIRALWHAYKHKSTVARGQVRHGSWDDVWHCRSHRCCCRFC